MKKGISLIVLVITIIVMIILAAAVTLTLTNTGIIGKANVAVNKTNQEQIEHLASLAWAEAYMAGHRFPDEIETYIKDKLKDVNLSGYIINVTDKGVEVFENNKGQNGNEGNNRPSNPDNGNDNDEGNNNSSTGDTTEYQSFLPEEVALPVEDNRIVWTQNGTTVTNGNKTLMVGEYVDYNYQSSARSNNSEEIKWRVLGADKGSLLLIADKNVTNLTISNINDYYDTDTGKSKLQLICDEYGNGVGAFNARSVKIEDINRITGYNPNNVGVYDPLQTGKGTKAYQGSGILEYGTIVTYTMENGALKYVTNKGVTGPTTHEDKRTFFVKLDGTRLQAGEVGVRTQTTYYTYDPLTLRDGSSGTQVGISSSSDEYKMLFEYEQEENMAAPTVYVAAPTTKVAADYWTDSICLENYNSFAIIEVHYVSNNYVSCNRMYDSVNGTGDVMNGGTRGVRPVVVMDKDATVTYGTNGWEVTM